MSSPYETVCEAIESAGYRVRRNHETSRAQCPGHDSSGYTLSIRETDDGTALVHCFANCETRDVLDAIGLEPRDLFASDVRGWSA